ncbi:MAG: FAD-dependent oxidoreductase, partial [Paracoccaceae bacterium]
MTRTQVVSAERIEGGWQVLTRDMRSGEETTHYAKMLVNAAGPWVGDVLRSKLRLNSQENVRLVRGSHIVVPKLYDHDKCYFFQGTDGRIIFAIPYEQDFTLIGTTDADHQNPDEKPVISNEERDYLCRFASEYFKKQITADDVVWTYSGVRPLYDDGASSATAATRDYVLDLDRNGAPLLSVFGGKITTYRKLAQQALAKLELGKDWTAEVPLPGGDFPVDGVRDLVEGLLRDYPFLTQKWAARLVRAYGTEARLWLGDA